MPASCTLSHDFDNEAYAHQAVQKLVNRGRKRIALLQPPSKLTHYTHTRIGFQTGLHDYGAEEVPLRVQYRRPARRDPRRRGAADAPPLAPLTASSRQPAAPPSPSTPASSRRQTPRPRRRPRLQAIRPDPQLDPPRDHHRLRRRPPRRARDGQAGDRADRWRGCGTVAEYQQAGMAGRAVVESHKTVHGSAVRALTVRLRLRVARRMERSRSSARRW